MIKNLYLVRHGKAVSDFLGSDIDRSLKERGINDSYSIAERLLKNKQVPELIVSSTAARALHTAIIFARVFKLPSSKIRLESDLYLADPHTILDIACKTDDHIHSVLMVGHNPGFTDLSNFFLYEGIDNIPTTGVVGLKFDIDFWPDIINIRPIESFFDYPKNII